MRPLEMALTGILAMMLIIHFWVGAIFYAVQRGSNQVIKELESLDARSSSPTEKQQLRLLIIKRNS